ncbi:interleukin-1 receptor type 1 [Brachyistius frenatus]|uniref:interleukin-1 receptor type 1 n=1 Tax=Brachyistius frenatus TaxID=100188 RepID=UPI0037E9C7FE
MEAFRLLFLVVVVISTSECSETTQPECKDLDTETFRILEDEAFYFVPLTLFDPNNPNVNFTWYKNSSQFEKISSDERDRVHFHGGALFFLNPDSADSGHYTARKISSSGKCYNYHVNINFFSASYRGSEAFTYGPIENSDLNKKIPCPDPVSYTCKTFKGNFTWYKELNLLPGKNEENLWVNDVTKHEGMYTCICTWTHNHKVYNSSASRRLKHKGLHKHDDIQILTPSNKEQVADEGLKIILNCSIYCGVNVKRDCDASWLVNGNPAKKMDISTKMFMVNPSNITISTTILTIDKVSAKHFQDKFMCVGVGFNTYKTASLTLKRRESITPLVIGGVCVLLFCVIAAMLVKWFAIDLTLFFRPFCTLRSRNEDARLYDAYVVYQTQGIDKGTENTLSMFITKSLPSVLEKKCGYRLFLHGRDDIPGEDRLEVVEKCMRQSRRLMVLLTPGSGSGSETTDGDLLPPQTSAIGGFDWQVGLHHALVQREMNVILIQLGDTGPEGYTHLPPGVQHLIRKSAPIRWPECSQGAAAWNSRFWKKVRYLMPATPAKKRALSDII